MIHVCHGKHRSTMKNIRRMEKRKTTLENAEENAEYAKKNEKEMLNEMQNEKKRKC